MTTTAATKSTTPPSLPPPLRATTTTTTTKSKQEITTPQNQEAGKEDRKNAKKAEATASVERVVEALGAFSVFTLVQSICFLLGYLSDSYQYFAYVFTGQEVPHSCSTPANSSQVAPDLGDVWLNATDVTYGHCVISVVTNVSGDVRTEDMSCVYGVEYEKPKDISIVSEFDLVCERKALASLTQSVLYFGNGVGAIVCPWLSDLYGRKRVIVVSQILTIGASLLSTFAPTYAVYAASRFLCGFLVSGIGIIAITAAVEVMPASHRGYVAGAWACLWWAVCVGSLSPIAYAVRFHSWRTLQTVVTASAGTVVLMMLILDEPVQWLVANGKTKEAERVLKRAARWNRKDPQAILDIFHRLNTNQSISPPPESQPLNETHSLHSGRTQPNWEETHSLNASRSDAQDPLNALHSQLSEKTQQEWEEAHSLNASRSDAQDPLNALHSQLSEKTQQKWEETHSLNASRSDAQDPLNALHSQLNEKTQQEWEETHSLNASRSDVQDKGKVRLNVEERNASVTSSLKEDSSHKEEGALPFSTLLRHPRMRINILLNWFLWFFDCLIYDALYLLTDTLALDIYWGFLLNAMVEGAASLVMLQTLNRFGRKKTIGLFHAISGVGLMASGICFHFKDSEALQITGTVFSLCGKLAISGSYTAIYLYTPEIFPTNLRNRALGTAVTASTLGGIVASFSNILVDYAVWAPGVIFGVCSFLAMLLLLALPESLGRELPQNIRDLERWYDVTSSTDTDQEEL